MDLIPETIALAGRIPEGCSACFYGQPNGTFWGKAKTMPHIVDPLRDMTQEKAINHLESAHTYIVSRARLALAQPSCIGTCWGISTKRLSVDLSICRLPNLVQKASERLSEVMNIAATIERTLGALRWFRQESRFQALLVHHCHPSTSSERNSNDIRLADSNQRVCVY